MPNSHSEPFCAGLFMGAIIIISAMYIMWMEKLNTHIMQRFCAKFYHTHISNKKYFVHVFLMTF